MTELIFRYSPIYDKTFFSLASGVLTEKQKDEGYLFERTITNYWKKNNTKIFSYYKDLGFVLPEFWLAYPVHHQKGLIPFADPLTFFIKENLEETMATLVHELCHVFFGYFENSKTAEPLWRHVASIFKEENISTKEHLLVNLLAQGGLMKLYGHEKAEKMLAPERGYEGLERAWKIIDNQNLPDHPLEAIKALQNNKS